MDILKLFFALLTDVSEDIVENEIASRLLSENKGLDKFFELG